MTDAENGRPSDNALIGKRVVLKRPESDYEQRGKLHSIDTQGYMVEVRPGVFTGFSGDVWGIEADPTPRPAFAAYVEEE